jgi:hypothetical protein
MQKTIAILTLVFLFFFSSSCMTSNLQHSNPDNESNIIKETRAFITTKEIKAKAVPAALIPALIGAVAPVAIDKGIDFLGALLKAAAEREEVTRAAFVNDHFYFLKKARLRFNVAPPAKELKLFTENLARQINKILRINFGKTLMLNIMGYLQDQA